MICCQFLDAGPWLRGFVSNVLNLCNLRNLRIFTSSGSGLNSVFGYEVGGAVRKIENPLGVGRQIQNVLGALRNRDCGKIRFLGTEDMLTQG